MTKRLLSAVALSVTAALTLGACSPKTTESEMAEQPQPAQMEQQQLGKPVVYQVFTRLFGNTNDTNKPWGTIEENGVGKFSDFTVEALQGIKQLGVTHVWYTGVPHHAVIRDYSDYGISADDPDVVKGRAGSPYAVKDYYSVNPDLADDPANRVAEFEDLIARTHAQDMKVIIDIVPNHVARGYESLDKPEGVSDFGANDDTSVEYARDNNFYYVVGQDFEVPDGLNGYLPLGGENHPMADAKFDESPAKWTGNGSRSAKPHANDWYETVKVNYGVKPDGSYDFDRLPAGYDKEDYRVHAAYWQDKDVPDSWEKFRDIAHYWLDKGVDGFRYDMAEMVPVEFWSYLNSSIKMKNPESFLMAEVYNPSLYRDYIHLGKMDYLYDKVEFYDTLKAIMQEKGSTDELENIQHRLADIEEHMLHFLENHDEQRIASPDFAGDANLAKPALVASALISRSPTMLYFGQDVGEDGSEETGFGDPTRTTIFDYAGVPAHQRWMNDGKFDGGQLSAEEKALREYHIKVMQISATNAAMQGEYASLHSFNRSANNGYDDRLYSFARWQGDDKLIVVNNFDKNKDYNLTLQVPQEVISNWQMTAGEYALTDLMTDNKATLEVTAEGASVSFNLAPLASVVYKVQ